MVPAHLAEGLSVRYGFFRTLYHMFAPVYELPRAWCYFGEDLFLDAIRPGDRILELGSGTGFLTRMVAEKAGGCVGLELEPAMVERAANRGHLTRYVAGKMEDIPFRDNTFDRCISLGAFHCVDHEAVAEAIFRVLKDNGEFLLLTEAKIIPRLAPTSAPARIRCSLEKTGFDVIEEKPVGRLYTWFRGKKRSRE